MGTEIFAYLFFFLLWGWIMFWWLLYLQKKNQKTAGKIIEDAKAESQKIIKESERKAQSIADSSAHEQNEKMKKIERYEAKILEKEDKLDQKYEMLEQQKETLHKQNEEVKEILKKQTQKLVEVAWCTQQEAKSEIMKSVEIEYSSEISQFIQKFKSVKQDEALKNAAEIITKVLPRVAVDQVSEFTVSNVDIPSEDTKWKLIWREWRNISYFEKVTWVELVIDDTPMMVKISSYDPEKRFLATETLKKLIKDWRINPVYIKKLYDEVSAWLDKRLFSKWEETLQSLWLPLMKPDIVKMIGQFYLRYSYWQNLLVHSIEVARIAELIANELWLDWILAKKAWILHDIWKISAITWQWHSKIWWDILRKYWFEEAIVNSAEWHHNDVPLTTPISWIVTAADAISASRPWARFNTKELFLERMSNLEKLISSISWTDKVFIMQAWREIMVFAKPDEVSDVWLEKLVKEIAIKVEDQLDYPWVIRVMAIRETKVVDYLK